VVNSALEVRVRGRRWW